jgi:hypothetical protein
VRLDAVDPCNRGEVGHGEGYSRDQATSANGHHHGSGIWYVIEDLEAQRPLTGHDQRIIEGV